MRSFLYLFVSLTTMALGAWAYMENYKTQAAIEQSDQLKREISQLQEELTVLRAEWAYQKRPDRLRKLVEMNALDLGLAPLEPSQFSHVDQLAFPAQPGDNITDTVEVSGSMKP